MTVKTARTSHGTARAKFLNFFWNDENGTDSARFDYGKYFECFYRNYGRDTGVRAWSRHGHGKTFESFHSNYGTDVARSRKFHSHTKTALAGISQPSSIALVAAPQARRNTCLFGDSENPRCPVKNGFLCFVFLVSWLERRINNLQKTSWIWPLCC